MDQIITENRDGSLRIEINRPDKKNALTSAMPTSGAAAGASGNSLWQHPDRGAAGYSQRRRSGPGTRPGDR